YEDDYTFVAAKDGQIIFKSSEKGIKPMYRFVTEIKERAKDASIADRVIGRGAALLASTLGIREIYAELISKEGIDVLKEHDIPYAYDVLCNYIKNKDRTDYCPIEKLSMWVEDPSIILRKLENFFNKK